MTTNTRGATSSCSAAPPADRGDRRGRWLTLCAGLPPLAGGMTGRVARERAAGARRGLGVRRRAGASQSLARPPRALAACARLPLRPRGRAVIEAAGRVTGIDLTAERRERFDELAGQCVSCGLCLPSCPTFDLLAAETDGPRGRIHIMQRLVAGDLSVEDAAARSTAASAAAPARSHARPTCSTASCSRSPATAARRRPPLQVRTLLSFVRRPRLLSLALRAGRPLARFVPGAAGRSGRALDAHEPVTWERRRPGAPQAVVLRGCVMREAFGGVQQAAVDSLAAAGYDVVAGPEQGCCGALHLHNGELATGEDDARAAARGRARRRDPRLDRRGLRGGAARARRARARSQRGARARALPAAGSGGRARRGVRRLPSAARPGRARGTARAAARRRLRDGRAGRRGPLLRRRRCVLVHTARAVTAARAEPRRRHPRERRRVVSCGNPGCAMQLRRRLREARLDVRVAHPAELAVEAT